MRLSRREWLAGPAALALGAAGLNARAEQPLKLASIGGGVELHYLEVGRGEPLIFVHGSLGNLSYWSDQMGPFAERLRAIAYSRRYNYPNANAAIDGYSAIVDADDLARLIR